MTSECRSKQRIFMRTDSSNMIGSGHVIRCLTLADALRDRGAEVQFICRPHPGHMISAIRNRGYGVLELPVVPSDSAVDRMDSDTWNGVPESSDVDQTLEALNTKPDWLVVDHYACGKNWEERARSHCGRLMAIDDLGRPHECDILLDHNWVGPGTASRYDATTPPDSERLLGPRFALLAPDYAMQRTQPVDRRRAVSRILIFFGASDRHSMTSLAMRAVHNVSCCDLAVDLVTGLNAASTPVKSTGPRSLNVSHHRNLRSLAPLLATADLAIGAVGGNTWERMCLGVPTIAYTVAANQEVTAKALADEGLIVFLGRADHTTDASLATALEDLLHDPTRRQFMADAGQELVDGLGAERVASHMIPT